MSTKIPARSSAYAKNRAALLPARLDHTTGPMIALTTVDLDFGLAVDGGIQWKLHRDCPGSQHGFIGPASVHLKPCTYMIDIKY
jgi:hypothetical protein